MNEPVKLGYTRQALMQTIKQHLGKVNTAIEIGTWRGDYAAVMCHQLKPNRFYAVDPFALYEGYTDKPNPTEFANQRNLDILADQVKHKIASMLPEGRSELIRDMSCNAVNQFDDNSVDVVYIDADHKYEPVLADIRAWYAKVKPGGILCGDDYIEGSHIEKFGVIEAVKDFAKENNLKFAVTSGGNPSWVFCKNNENMLF
jgi:predicted O-methyltransferase YrrM